MKRTTELRSDPATTRRWRERSRTRAAERAAEKAPVVTLRRDPEQALAFERRARANSKPPAPRSLSPASRVQRAKVREAEGCRVRERHEFDDELDVALPAPIADALATWGAGPVDPMHVVDRSIGGCDDGACAIPACRPIHLAYDDHQFNVLPYLTLLEQAHAVGHLGIVGALKRVTGLEWAPVNGVPADPARDRLPYLTELEQAEIVAHVGILEALEETTGQRWLSVVKERCS